MSWAEFVLRSIGFKRTREHDLKLTRILAYEVHKGQYMYSKKNPPSIERFWPIEGKKSVSETQKEAFIKAYKAYKDKSNG